MKWLKNILFAPYWWNPIILIILLIYFMILLVFGEVKNWRNEFAEFNEFLKWK